MQWFANSPLPEPSRLSGMDGSMLKVLIVVGGLVMAFMLYLVVDWFRARLAMRKFEARRRQARKEWQQELQQLKDAKDGQEKS